MLPPRKHPQAQAAAAALALSALAMPIAFARHEFSRQLDPLPTSPHGSLLPGAPAPTAPKGASREQPTLATPALPLIAEPKPGHVLIRKRDGSFHSERALNSPLERSVLKK